MTDWPLWLLALIELLAVHRLTRLVTADIITVRVRWRIIAWSYERAGHDEGVYTGQDGGNGSGAHLDSLVEADMTEDPCDVPRLAVLVVCRWCASVWIAAAVVAAHALIPAVWLPVAAVLALSSASTMLSALEE